MKNTKKTQLFQDKKKPIFSILKLKRSEAEQSLPKVNELTTEEDNLGLSMIQRLTLSIILKGIWLSNAS